MILKEFASDMGKIGLFFLGLSFFLSGYCANSSFVNGNKEPEFVLIMTVVEDSMTKDPIIINTTGGDNEDDSSSDDDSNEDSDDEDDEDNENCLEDCDNHHHHICPDSGWKWHHNKWWWMCDRHKIKHKCHKRRKRW